MSKVFVTQENSRLNYSDAERFGEIVFVASDEYSPHLNSKRNLKVRDQILKSLIGFNKQTDFLLLCGDPIIMALCFYEIAVISDTGTVQLLKWDNQNKRYNSVKVNILMPKCPDSFDPFQYDLFS